MTHFSLVDLDAAYGPKDLPLPSISVSQLSNQNIIPTWDQTLIDSAQIKDPIFGGGLSADLFKKSDIAPKLQVNEFFKKSLLINKPILSLLDFSSEKYGVNNGTLQMEINFDDNSLFSNELITLIDTFAKNLLKNSSILSKDQEVVKQLQDLINNLFKIESYSALALIKIDENQKGDLENLMDPPEIPVATKVYDPSFAKLHPELRDRLQKQKEAKTLNKSPEERGKRRSSEGIIKRRRKIRRTFPRNSR